MKKTIASSRQIGEAYVTKVITRNDIADDVQVRKILKSSVSFEKKKELILDRVKALFEEISNNDAEIKNVNWISPEIDWHDIEYVIEDFESMNRNSSIVEPIQWHKFQFSVTPEADEDIANIWGTLIKAGADAIKSGKLLLVEIVSDSLENAKKEIETILGKEVVNAYLKDNGLVSSKIIFRDEDFTITASTIYNGKIRDKRNYDSIQNWSSDGKNISYEFPDSIPRHAKLAHKKSLSNLIK